MTMLERCPQCDYRVDYAEDVFTWQVQGSPRVNIPWGEVTGVCFRSWYDWVVLQIAKRPYTRHIPARFGPRGAKMNDFGRMIEQYWLRYGRAEKEAVEV
jgi:hypothetical protein